jgi:hypothetical protein
MKPSGDKGMQSKVGNIMGHNSRHFISDKKPRKYSDGMAILNEW